jgi:hypothetical protein
MKPVDPVLRAQRKRLATWLTEWRLAQRLETDEAETASGPCAVARTYPTARTRRRLSSGAILLLPPDRSATRGRPVYVALLEETAPEVWRVAPFGRFATPAVPGELALRRQALPLRVLCLWNTAQLTQARLVSAYQVGRLTAAERGDIAALRAHLGGTSLSAPLPEPLARRIGPPLGHPLDPRQRYLEESRALWLDAAAARERPWETPRELPMAAERADTPEWR